jgi:hypothetical protein
MKRSLKISVEVVSVAEAKKVPVEVIREPVGKSVLKISGMHQNVLVSIQSF